MSKAPPKEPYNQVHQNAILCETVGKELRYQKLYLNYSINPFKKMHTLAGKPNSLHDTEDGEEDGIVPILAYFYIAVHFKDIIKRAAEEPTKKYNFPQTSSQEYGWISKPLIDGDRNDKRLHFLRSNTEITNYMEAAWKHLEQANMN